MGDVSWDGVVSPDDALLIQQYLLGEIALSDAQLSAADVDGDAELTLGDAALILEL